MTTLTKDQRDQMIADLSAEHKSADPVAKLPSREQMIKDLYAAQPSKLESGLRGAAQGAMMGWADEATGALESAFTDKTYEQARDESRQAYKEAETANPKTYFAGQLGGGLATALVPGLNVAKGAGALARVGMAAGMGAVDSLGQSEKEDVGGLAKDAVKGAALGGVVGSAGEAIGSAIKNTRAEDLKRLANYLSAKAMGAERGTIKKLGDSTIQEIGDYGLKNKIVAPLANTEDMIGRNLAAREKGGELMNKAYSAADGMGASINPLDTAVAIEDKVGDFWRSPINKGETNQLENTLESVLMRGGKGDANIPLGEAQKLKEELGKVANWKNNLTVTDKEKMARDAYSTVSDQIDNAIVDPAAKVNLSEGKNLYSKSMGAEELLTNKNAREQGNKMFGITDGLTGIAGVSAMGPAGILAVGAKKVAEKYGAQTSAVGLDKLSRFVNTAAGKKYRAVLESAYNRGGNKGLAVTHYLLMQRDPQYREAHMKSED